MGEQGAISRDGTLSSIPYIVPGAWGSWLLNRDSTPCWVAVKPTCRSDGVCNVGKLLIRLFCRIDDHNPEVIWEEPKRERNNVDGALKQPIRRRLADHSFSVECGGVIAMPVPP